VAGLYGSPTEVNNVESIAATVPLDNEGGEENAKIDIERSTETRLISACEDLVKPGEHEIEMELPVEEFIFSDEYCGGIASGKRLKAVVAGGSSVPILPANLITKTINGNPRLMTYECLADGGFVSGTAMGSGGFIAFDEDQC